MKIIPQFVTNTYNSIVEAAQQAYVQAQIDVIGALADENHARVFRQGLKDPEQPMRSPARFGDVAPWSNGFATMINHERIDAPAHDLTLADKLFAGAWALTHPFDLRDLVNETIWNENLRTRLLDKSDPSQKLIWNCPYSGVGIVVMAVPLSVRTPAGYVEVRVLGSRGDQDRRFIPAWQLERV